MYDVLREWYIQDPIFFTIVLVALGQVIVWLSLKKSLVDKLSRVEDLKKEADEALVSASNLHCNAEERLAEMQNLLSEMEEYGNRIKYILDSSGWSSVKLTNLMNAIKEINYGEDTKIVGITDISPKAGAPTESNKSVSLGAGPQDDNKIAEVQMTKNNRNKYILIVLAVVAVVVIVVHIFSNN